MKKQLLAVLPAILFANLLIAQVEEATQVNIGFYKVEDGKRAEYETVMMDYFGPIMKKRVENGCMQNWIFRRVAPASNASNYFTHVTIDVLMPGKTNYQCEGVTPESVFPDMSEGMHQLLWDTRTNSRKVVYRTWTEYVTGFSRDDKVVELAAFNFIRIYPGKGANYINSHKEYAKDFFEKYSNQAAWHALRRIDPLTGGSEEWNYLTIDGYNTMEEKRNRTMNAPEDLVKERIEKYGRNPEMRDLMYHVVTRLLMSARE